MMPCNYKSYQRRRKWQRSPHSTIFIVKQFFSESSGVLFCFDVVVVFSAITFLIYCFYSDYQQHQHHRRRRHHRSHRPINKICGTLFGFDSLMGKNSVAHLRNHRPMGKFHATKMAVLGGYICWEWCAHQIADDCCKVRRDWWQIYTGMANTQHPNHLFEFIDFWALKITFYFINFLSSLLLFHHQMILIVSFLFFVYLICFFTCTIALLRDAWHIDRYWKIRSKIPA